MKKSEQDQEADIESTVIETKKARTPSEPEMREKNDFY